ncbi:MAG: glycosyl hydrolase 115 family protein, partial [Kiritimatiellia bacterium]|nr:glycosyl hydrolase 115 family protein [Kiritimatiellia bacterium]
ITPDLGGIEQYAISLSVDEIRIRGSDRLGAIFGIYAFCERLLGIDPLYFWKDLFPAPTAHVEIQEGEIRSKPYAIRYRGWFLNDEDFLCEWKPGGGRRHLTYPYYGQVPAPEVMDAVFEAALRCRANLIIPASFTDVMNPPEAGMVRRAVARGLYVSQHHVEPLGVSHFAFDTFWENRGRPMVFSYGRNPDAVRETWRAYAARWVELAGDRIVWQLGLRGRGDAPVWDSDPGVAQADAADLISRAIQDQRKIVLDVDPRAAPVMTVTLWDEMSELMRGGGLALPEEILVVFSDHGPTQEIQADFRETPRKPGVRYGVYSHIAQWDRGGHFIQGCDPFRLERTIRAVMMKGDTEYAIFNVANIREHVLGIQAAMDMTADLPDWDADLFLDRFAGPLKPDYIRFFHAIAQWDSGPFQDGDAHRNFLSWLQWREAMATSGAAHFEPFEKHGFHTPEKRRAAERRLEASLATFDLLAGDAAIAASPFHRIHLGLQSALMAELYRLNVCALRCRDGLKDASDAVRSLQHILELRKKAEEGRWKNWYRGDRKANWKEMLNRLQKLERKERV